MNPTADTISTYDLEWQEAEARVNARRQYLLNDPAIDQMLAEATKTDTRAILAESYGDDMAADDLRAEASLLRSLAADTIDADPVYQAHKKALDRATKRLTAAVREADDTVPTIIEATPGVQYRVRQP